MARAIPGFLGLVPTDDAVQMRADSRALMQRAAVIAIDGDFSPASTNDGSFAGFDRCNVVELAFREIILVLLGDIDVFLDVLRSSAKLDARWIIESRPLVLPALNQLVEDDAGDGAMSHTVPGIASGNPNVLIAARVLSNVSHVVDRLDDLT